MVRFFIILIGLCLAHVAPAATRYVSTNGASPDGNYLTWATAATNIQDAVFAATNNETVLVTNGLYTCASSLSGSYRAMIIVTNVVMLQSVNGPAVTLVDGGNTGEFTNRCFYVNNNAVVSGFTITNGRANADTPNNIGGGVVVGSLGTVTNCWILGNSNTNSPELHWTICGRGAGAFVVGGILKNSVIAGNTGTNRGGGVYATSSGLVQDCTISNNSLMDSSCGYGGGIFLAGNSTGINCRITHNIILTGSGGGNTPAGGGAMLDGGWLINCLVNNNTTLVGCGGGVGMRSGFVSNCVIVSNTAGEAGGIYARNYGSILIQNCTVSTNMAAYTGGIAVMCSGTVRNCLISKNWATAGNAGGVYGYQSGSSTQRWESCTIVSNYCNSSTVAGGIEFRDLGSSPQSLFANCIIYSNKCTGAEAFYNWRTNSGPNISISFSNCCTTPTNSSYGVLPGANNITNNPKFMDYSAGNFRLTNGSPCINTGTNQDWMTGAKDLDGHSRLDGFSGFVDIGAYEYLPKGTVVSIR